MGKPAILPELRQRRRLGAGQRTIKMLRPICAVCGGEDAVPDWPARCPHDPYVTAVPIPVKVPIYEDILGEDGQPTGTKKLVGTEEQVSYRARPNWVEVALTPRVNTGLGYRRGRAKGFILPGDLHSEGFPDGIAPICQFRECYSQKGLKQYQSGVFCRHEEAELVWYDAEGKVLEYDHDLDQQSRSKRAEMLAKAPV